MEHTEYLGLLIACWIVPFVFLLIHRRVFAPDGLRIIQPSIVFASIPFLVFDRLAVGWGYWSFSSRFLTGFHLLGLPIEEYAFHLLIPQACLLIWIFLSRYPKTTERIDALLHHWRKR